MFSEHLLKEFVSCNYSNRSLYHFRLGIWIRNHLLYEKSPLYQMFIKAGVVQKDDMSSPLIHLFYLDMHAKHQ